MIYNAKLYGSRRHALKDAIIYLFRFIFRTSALLGGIYAFYTFVPKPSFSF